MQSSRADGRPTTAAIITPRKDSLSLPSSSVSSPSPSHPLSGSGGKPFSPGIHLLFLLFTYFILIFITETANYPTGKQLTMKFLSTWGDRHYMGLTGFILYDPKGKPIPINSKYVSLSISCTKFNFFVKLINAM